MAENRPLSLDSFVAWWSVVKEDAEHIIEEYEVGDLKLYKNNEDVSQKALASLRRTVKNMEAMIAQAKRDKEC